MPLILNGATSGSTTIQATDAVTQTITLPNNSGTVLTTASNTNFPAGSVLQVVNATFATQTSTTSTSFVDTGLSASITPSSSSNKILAIVNMTGLSKSSSDYMGLQLVRGSTVIAGFELQALFTSSAVTITTATGTSYLDSPSTTSSTTYKVQAKSFNGGIVYWSSSNAVTTITLMEIKG